MFTGLNETQLLPQESKLGVIELPQKVMFSAHLNTSLISNRDLCKSLTNNKCHFCLLFLVTKSYLTLLRSPWTIACQAPLSMGFLRQEYWRGLPFPTAGDLPDQRMEPMSPAWQVDSLPLSYQGRLYFFGLQIHCRW